MEGNPHRMFDHKGQQVDQLFGSEFYCLNSGWRIIFSHNHTKSHDLQMWCYHYLQTPGGKFPRYHTRIDAQRTQFTSPHHHFQHVIRQVHMQIIVPLILTRWTDDWQSHSVRDHNFQSPYMLLLYAAHARHAEAVVQLDVQVSLLKSRMQGILVTNKFSHQWGDWKHAWGSAHIREDVRKG